MAGLKRLVFNPSLSFEKQRARLRVATQAGGGSVSLRSVDIAGVRCDEYVPQTAASTTAIVYVHGGGYCVGSPALGAPFIAALADALQLRAVLVDYRLAPEVPAPGAVNDVVAVLRATGSDVIVVGDSAGAGALVAALQQVTVRAAVLLSPWLDLTDDRLARPELVEVDPVLSPTWLEQCAAAYAGENRSDPMVSPLLGELSLPPTIVVGGTDDILAPDATRLVAILRSQISTVHEIVVPDMWHDFALAVGRLEAADVALDEIVRLLTPLVKR